MSASRWKHITCFRLLCAQDDPTVYGCFKEKECASLPWSSTSHEPTSVVPRRAPAFESRRSRTRAGPSWDPARWSQRWLQLGYEWAKLLCSRCLWRAPFSRRGEAKLNKYLLHPVCIKGLHTWRWRQSDIKQGGVARPAPTGTCTHARAHTCTHTHICSSIACY